MTAAEINKFVETKTSREKSNGRITEASAAAQARVSITWPSVATKPMSTSQNHRSGVGAVHTNSAGISDSGVISIPM